MQPTQLQEFLVHFEIRLPPGMSQDAIAELYELEAEAARPYLENGTFRRVWRIPGNRNHWALWLAPDAETVHRAYASFPMWKGGYGSAEVHPLGVNPNDPGLRNGQNPYAEAAVELGAGRRTECDAGLVALAKAFLGNKQAAENSVTRPAQQASYRDAALGAGERLAKAVAGPARLAEAGAINAAVVQTRAHDLAAALHGPGDDGPANPYTIARTAWLLLDALGVKP